MGLLTVMAQSGLPIPAGADSTLGWHDDVLADIGDEQSVAGNLSTFSYHIQRLGEILRRVEAHSNSRSLVLLDEIGTGTDPDQGAALSMAILLRLQRNGTQVIATSHYDSLKGFVYGAKRMENAAVDFDQKSLKPLYHLRVGTPGNSNTLSMARQFGLDDELIREAEGYLNEEYLRLDKLINEFEEERQLRQSAEAETNELRRELSQTRLDNTRRTAALQAGKTKEMMKLRDELYDELARIEGQIESAQAKLKRSKHAPTDAGLSTPRRKLREQKRKLKEKLDSAEEPKSVPAIPGELAVGDSVRLEGAKSAAALIALRGNNAVIAMGAMKMTVPVSRLTRVASSKRKTTDVALDNLALTEREVPSELMLRGMYVEEGLALLERYLDEAALVGLSQVRIIHGKGTWVMRNAVVDYLKNHPRVVEYFTPEQRAGGTGVTIAVLD
jgi:DNA mismatch repair protein MutS2